VNRESEFVVAISDVTTHESRISVVFQAMRPNNAHMTDHIYKKIELVGSSPNSFDDAVKNALERAQKTMRNIRWFEVTETRGYLEDGKIAHWQVTLKVGFTLEG
jgi:flavin-binding protein dodecin